MCSVSSGAQSRGGAGTTRGKVARTPYPLHLDAAEPQLLCGYWEQAWAGQYLTPSLSWTTMEVMRQCCPGLALHPPFILRHLTFPLLLRSLSPSSRLDKPDWISCCYPQLAARAALQVIDGAGGAKPCCLRAFELVWELLEALVSGEWWWWVRRRVLEETSEGQDLEEAERIFLLPPKKIFAPRSFFCDCPVLGQCLGCFAPMWCLSKRLWRNLLPPVPCFVMKEEGSLWQHSSEWADVQAIRKMLMSTMRVHMEKASVQKCTSAVVPLNNA